MPLCASASRWRPAKVFAFMVDNSFSNWKGYVRTTPPPHDAVAFLVVFLFFLFVLFLSSPTL
jgi:hypothetical protein